MVLRRMIVLVTALAAIAAAIVGAIILLTSTEVPEPPPDLTKRRTCKDVGRQLTSAEICDRLRRAPAQGRDGDPRPEDLNLDSCEVRDAPPEARLGAVYIADYQINHPTYMRSPEAPIYVDACGHSLGGVYYND